MLLRLAPFALLLLAGCAPPLTTVTKESKARDYGAPEVYATLEDARVDESSGLAPSRVEKGVYYTHNDSGDGPRFFKFDGKGRVLGVYRVTNARAVDWEDMASARLDGKPYLFFGDIGDNPGKRESIRVYRVPEPEGDSGGVRADAIYTLRYSDEPHNAETLLVHPKTGDITVVTKAAKRPSMVFHLPRPRRGGRYTMRKVGELQLGGPLRESKLVTGGAISPDGRFVVLRTYLSAYEFPLSGKPGEWAKKEPTRIGTGLEMQGEAITYSPSGEALLTSSEFSPCTISKIPLAR